jgi:hypothetical protein
MAFSFAEGFSKLKDKINEFVRSGKIYVMKGDP